MAFGEGWTPCIGPILSGILFIAAQGTIVRAVFLLLSYSLGLALPFLITALFFDSIKPVWQWLKNNGNVIRIISGLMLITLGIAMILGRLSFFNSRLMRYAMLIQKAYSQNYSNVKLATILLLVFLLLALFIPSLIRKKRVLHPLRLLFSAILLVCIILEASNVINFALLLSRWFMFQGY
jgi:cytochrome c-type biogenesis protein